MSARQELIDATRTLLSRQGYEATSPADIQRASGVGQGSFYHHFSGKADLASVALQATADEMCAAFDELLEQRPESPVAAYLDSDRDALAGCRIGRICMESSLGDDRIRLPVASYFAHLRDRLTVAFDRLDLPIPSQALADLAIATVQGAYVTSRAAGDPSPMAGATSALRDLILAAGRKG